MKFDTAKIENFDTLTADELREALKNIELPEDNTEAYEKLKGEYQKKSAAFDRTSSELAEAKKQAKAKMSQDEIDREEMLTKIKALEERNEILEKTAAIKDYTDKYIELGYDKKNAAKMAEAQFEGNTETMFELMTAQNKAFENKIKSDLVKGTPLPDGAGGGGSEKTPENIEAAMAYGAARANAAKTANEGLKNFI